MSGPPHILVLEDDAKYRNAVAFNLTRAGFRVTTAAESVKALLLTEHDHFDLVIVDYYLHDGLGTDFARLLREDDAHSHVPMILLTAWAEEVDEKYVRDELAALLISKPYPMPKLVDTVSQLVATAHGAS